MDTIVLVAEWSVVIGLVLWFVYIVATPWKLTPEDLSFPPYVPTPEQSNLTLHAQVFVHGMDRLATLKFNVEHIMQAPRKVTAAQWQHISYWMAVYAIHIRQGFVQDSEVTRETDLQKFLKVWLTEVCKSPINPLGTEDCRGIYLEGENYVTIDQLTDEVTEANLTWVVCHNDGGTKFQGVPSLFTLYLSVDEVEEPYNIDGREGTAKVKKYTVEVTFEIHNTARSLQA